MKFTRKSEKNPQNTKPTPAHATPQSVEPPHSFHNIGEPPFHPNQRCHSASSQADPENYRTQTVVKPSPPLHAFINHSAKIRRTQTHQLKSTLIGPNAPSCFAGHTRVTIKSWQPDHPSSKPLPTARSLLERLLQANHANAVSSPLKPSLHRAINVCCLNLSVQPCYAEEVREKGQKVMF